MESVKENFEPKEWQPIGTSVPNLAGEHFLVTGSGKYFRNVILKPEDSICMIEVDEKGENYRIVWGLVNGGRPTSELPSYLMNLEVKKLQDPKYRVVYHAHTTNIIAFANLGNVCESPILVIFAFCRVTDWQKYGIIFSRLSEGEICDDRGRTEKGSHGLFKLLERKG